MSRKILQKYNQHNKFNFDASWKILIIKYHYSTTSELPELPDFLKPTVKPTQRPLRPISDIDLPDGSFVIQPGEDEGEEETDEDKGLQCMFFCLLELDLHVELNYLLSTFLN